MVALPMVTWAVPAVTGWHVGSPIQGPQQEQWTGLKEPYPQVPPKKSLCPGVSHKIWCNKQLVDPISNTKNTINPCESIKKIKQSPTCVHVQYHIFIWDSHGLPVFVSICEGHYPHWNSVNLQACSIYHSGERGLYHHLFNSRNLMVACRFSAFYHGYAIGVLPNPSIIFLLIYHIAFRISQKSNT